MKISVAVPWVTTKSHDGSEENWYEITKISTFSPAAHLGGEGQVKTSDTKATGRKSGTAVGPLSSSSVGMAMSFSSLQALVYALLEDF